MSNSYLEIGMTLIVTELLRLSEKGRREVPCLITVVSTASAKVPST